jgi:pimeloyl-ACP methyl ester carboxylesterase
MTTNIINKITLAISGVLLLSATACKTNLPDPDPIVFEVMEDTTLLNTFQPEFVKGLISAAGMNHLSDKIKYPMQVYRVSYHTTYKGEDILASGLVCFPTGVTEEVPLLSGHHGTTSNDLKAPSNFSFAKQQYTLMEFFANAGYVTLIPDYIGFEASGDVMHPYYNYEHQSLAVVDLIRAAKEFLKAKEVNFSNDLFLFGYSEGGYTTLAAHKAIESDPTLELNIVATAAGAGGYDINGVMDQALAYEVYPSPAYLSYVISAYNETLEDWGQPLTDFFQEPYASKMPALFDGSMSIGDINSQLPQNLNELFQPELLEELRAGQGEKIRNAFTVNSVHDWAPVAPVRLYHSKEDEIVPYENSVQSFEVMQKNGAENMEFVTIEQGSHSGAVKAFVLDAINWFESFDTVVN